MARLLSRIKEAARFDFNALKAPVVLAVQLSCRLLIGIGLRRRALEIAGSIYRTGWPKSFSAGLDVSSRVMNCPGAYRTIFQAAIEALSAYSTEACHPVQLKAATQTASKLPPIGA